MTPSRERAQLVITADDYGLWPSYDDGILEAARAGAVDAVSVMVLRDPDPAPLAESGVEVGLHLEVPTTPRSSSRTDSVPDRTLGAAAGQVERFREIFGRDPSHLDGHHHCHAQGGRAALSVARLGRRLGIRVRSVSPRHRRLLRCLGIATNARLIGRLDESEAVVPAEIEALLAGGALEPGLIEWMVHPGHPDTKSGSSYNRGRDEDLALVLSLRDALKSVRGA